MTFCDFPGRRAIEPLARTAWQCGHFRRAHRAFDLRLKKPTYCGRRWPRSVWCHRNSKIPREKSRIVRESGCISRAGLWRLSSPLFSWYQGQRVARRVCKKEDRLATLSRLFLSRSERRDQRSNVRSYRPLQLEQLETSLVPTGTWQPLSNLAPQGVKSMILLIWIARRNSLSAVSFSARSV